MDRDIAAGACATKSSGERDSSRLRSCLDFRGQSKVTFEKRAQPARDFSALIAVIRSKQAHVAPAHPARARMTPLIDAPN
jgi:hypothetical protein